MDLVSGQPAPTYPTTGGWSTSTRRWATSSRRTSKPSTSSTRPCGPEWQPGGKWQHSFCNWRATVFTLGHTHVYLAFFFIKSFFSNSLKQKLIFWNYLNPYILRSNNNFHFFCLTFIDIWKIFPYQKYLVEKIRFCIWITCTK